MCSGISGVSLIVRKRRSTPALGLFHLIAIKTNKTTQQFWWFHQQKSQITRGPTTSRSAHNRRIQDKSKEERSLPDFEPKRRTRLEAKNKPISLGVGVVESTNCRSTRRHRYYPFHARCYHARQGHKDSRRLRGVWWCHTLKRQVLMMQDF